MKKLLIILVLFCLSIVGVANTVYATEDPQITETPQTTEVTEATEEVATDDGNFFDEPLLDNIAPKVQLGLQLVTFLYLIGSTIVAFKGNLKAMFLSKKLEDAQNELTIEQSYRNMTNATLINIGDVLNRIVQNSKLTTDDKLKINENFVNLKNQMVELNELSEQIKGVSKTDISSILENIGDIAGLALNNYEALKSGNLEDLDLGKEEDEEEEGV